MVIRFSKTALLLYPRICDRVYCQEKNGKGLKQFVDPFPKKYIRFIYILKKAVEKGPILNIKVAWRAWCVLLN